MDGLTVTREPRALRVTVQRPSAHCLAPLRAALNSFLSPLISERVRFHLVLAVDEAVTNALRHADGCPVGVCVHIREEGVTASVCDGGSGFDPSSLNTAWPPAPGAECGRGLYLVSCLMDSLAVDRTLQGTAVRFSRTLGRHEKLWLQAATADRDSSVAAPPA